MDIIKNLEWRYATKKFDPTRKVPHSDIEILKKAIRLSVSSYGLQLYKVLLIENQQLREQLKVVSWDQDQITAASHLFVFCNYTNIKPEDIDAYLLLTSEVRKVQPENLENYGAFMKMKLREKSAEEQKAWLEQQPYLALGNLLLTCAALKIDACPMEGFEAVAYNNILGLPEKDLNACVIAAVGYRHTDDKNQELLKVRKPMELLFEHV